MRHLVKKNSTLFMTIDSLSSDRKHIKSDHSLASKQSTIGPNNTEMNAISEKTLCNSTPISDHFDPSPQSLVKNIQLNEQLSQFIDFKDLDEVMRDLDDIDFNNKCFSQDKNQTNGNIDAIVSDLKTDSNSVVLKSSSDKRESCPENSILFHLMTSHSLTNECNKPDSKLSLYCSFNSHSSLNSEENKSFIEKEMTQNSCDKPLESKIDHKKGDEGHKNDDKGLIDGENRKKCRYVPKRQSVRQMLRNMDPKEAEKLSELLTMDQISLKSDISVTKLKSASYERKRIKLLSTINEIEFHLSKGSKNVWISYLKRRKDSPLSGLIKMEGDSERRIGRYGAFTGGCVHTMSVIAGVVRVTIETVQKKVETDEQIKIPSRSHYHIRNFKSEDAYIYFEIGLT